MAARCLISQYICLSRGTSTFKQISRIKVISIKFSLGYCPGGGGGGGGGGVGTWVFRGVHTLVIKMKKYP